MRKTFANLIYDKMKADDRIVIITADLGYMMWDNIKLDFPDRFYNCGSAEQLMVLMGVGMTYENKIPLCYSITPFLLYRPFEFLRNYVNYENIAVKLVGAGRNKDYSHDGISHWADDDEVVLSSLPNIQIFKPLSEYELVDQFPDFLYSSKPAYLNLIRNSTI